MKNKKSWIHVVVLSVAAVLTLVSFPFVGFALLYVAWSTPNHWLPWIVILFFFFLYAILWANILMYVFKGHLYKVKIQAYLIVPLILSGSVWGGYKIYEGYENSFEKVSTELDLNKYKPFQSDALAQLKEPSRLHVEEPLPKLDGATAFYPVYAAFVQAIYPEKEYESYDEENDVFHDEITCSTTPWAYDNLLRKEKDLIFVFEPSLEQQQAFDDANETMHMTAIGKESFVFFVNVENPVNSLSQEQIRDIYSGKITNWKEVGGKDEEILAYQRPQGSGSQTALLKIMGNTKPMTPIEENVVEGMGGIISETADYRNRENAIGYSFRYFAKEMVNNKKIKLLEIDGITPDKENIRNDTYPFIFPFYAVHLNSNSNVKIEPILNWILSPQGKELIEKSGYVTY